MKHYHIEIGLDESLIKELKQLYNDKGLDCEIDINGLSEKSSDAIKDVLLSIIVKCGKFKFPS